MAYTVTKTNINLGNINGTLCEVTADAASGNWTVPHGTVLGWVAGPKSMATAAIKIASSGQTVTVSNAASGDNFFLMVYGR
jgi:hypothetical protein